MWSPVPAICPPPFVTKAGVVQLWRAPPFSRVAARPLLLPEDREVGLSR